MAHGRGLLILAALVVGAFAVSGGLFSLAGSTQGVVVGDCSVDTAGDIQRCSPSSNEQAEIGQLDSKFAPRFDNTEFTVTVRNVVAGGDDKDPVVPWLFNNNLVTADESVTLSDVAARDVDTSRQVLDGLEAGSVCTLHEAVIVPRTESRIKVGGDSQFYGEGDTSFMDAATIDADRVLVNEGRNGVTCVFDAATLIKQGSGEELNIWDPGKGVAPELDGSVSVDFGRDTGTGGDGGTGTGGVVARLNSFVQQLLSGLTGLFR